MVICGIEEKVENKVVYMNYELINCISGVFTAIGTVGAVILSMYFACYKKKPRINALFLCGAATLDKPGILIQNTGKMDVVLDHIDVEYNKEHVGTIDFIADTKFSGYAIIQAKATELVPLPTTVLKEPKIGSKRKRELKITVFQRNGRKFITRERISDEKMMKLCFQCGLARSN